MAYANLTTLGLFIARKQFAAYTREPFRILAHALIGLTALAYAAAIALLIDHADAVGIRSATVIAGLNVGGAAFVLVSGWFPSLKRRTHIISPVHPLRPWHAASLETGLALFGFGPLCAGAALLLISSITTAYGPAALLATLLAWWGAFMADRTGRIVAQRSTRSHHGATAAFFLSVATWTLALALLAWTGASLLAIGTLLAAVAAETLTALRLETRLRQASPRGRTAATTSPRFGGHVAAVFRTRAVRLSLGAAFVFKSTILMVNTWVQANSGTLPLNEWFLNGLFGTPLLYFTYVLANTYGHARHLWLAERINAASIPHLLGRYAQIATPVLAVDALVSAVYFQVTGGLRPDIVTLYLTSTVLLVATGFVASVYLPVVVEKAFSFTNVQTNVSMLATLPIATLLSGNVLLVATGQLLLATGLAAALLGIAWQLGRSPRSQIHRCYRRLFTEG